MAQIEMATPTVPQILPAVVTGRARERSCALSLLRSSVRMRGWLRCAEACVGELRQIILPSADETCCAPAQALLLPVHVYRMTDR